jgi:phosphoglycolate phosphatase
MKRRINLAVFDLDNTLYDWYASFIPAFYSMVDEAVRALRCDRETLLDQLREVHRKYHDVEHPFSLMETPIVQAAAMIASEESIWQKLDPAFHAFNSVRKHNLRLFPGVRETLSKLEGEGVRLVAFTDSSFYASLRRVSQLELDDTFQHVYCRARAKEVGAIGAYQRRDPPSKLVEKAIELPANESKPDPAVLFDISAKENVSMDAIAYIGDSISRDVLMAKKAGCFAAWAKYGVHRDVQQYESLIRISHWSDADIQRERRFANEASKIAPDAICQHSIVEFLDFVCGP